MFKTYLKIAWRNMVRNKTFSFINITGLATGIAASLLLLIIVRYELSYDTFQKDHARIYRVVTQDKFSDGITYNAGIPVPALEALRTSMSDIEFGAVFSISGSQVTIPSAQKEEGNKFIEKTGIFFCEPQFLKIFQNQWLAGNPDVLKAPNSMVLSRSTAERYFGDWHSAMGQTVVLDNHLSVKVNGILQDAPGNTDFPLSVLISYVTLQQNSSHYTYADNWNTTSSDFEIFARVPPSVKAATVDQRLLAFSKEHYTGERASVKTNSLQPLADIHFDTRFNTFGDHVTRKATLWTLVLIGLFIVLMACVNFINLSTALAVNRSREVGIRKVLGSNRLSLFRQMMGETALLVLVAALLAMGIVWLVLPYVGHIASIPETLTLFQADTMLSLAALCAIVVVLAGIYPSFVLSRFNPMQALKNKILSAQVGGISLRRGLVVMQFAISQVLIVATAIAVGQMNFIRKADLGFNKETVLVLTGNNDSTTLARQAAFKQQLLQTPGIRAVSFSSDAPSSDNTWATNFAYDHRPDEAYQLTLKFADADYMKTYGLQLLAGHNYSPSDTIRELLINETLARKLGIKKPEEAIGKTIRISSHWYPIAGVVKDFKTNSLREAVKPLVVSTNKNFYWNTSVKLNTANLIQTQAAVQKIWNQYYPEYAYRGNFLDENIARFYQQENQLSLLYKIFAGLAIFISCLGLYGLVSFMAVRKTKEVGIRKALGASAGSIIFLFSREFTVLVVVAFLIAAPIAWYMMHNWLDHFVFRIDMGPGVFILAMAVSLVIAWLTVGYKAVRAALSNPVTALRSE